MHIIPFESLLQKRAVIGLCPSPIPAILIAPPTWLQCGKCGFNGEVTHYIISTGGEEPFEPVCNCPVTATLTA